MSKKSPEFTKMLDELIDAIKDPSKLFMEKVSMLYKVDYLLKKKEGS